MIALLRGTVEFRGDNGIIIDVNGVGYYVHLPSPVLNSVGREGSNVVLYTYQHVRENELSLYGFSSLDQRELFQQLLTVSGIGPRVAIGLLSTLAPDRLRLAIAEGNTAVLTSAPGVGKRTAERLILDLKDKIELGELVPAGEFGPADTEVLSALESLGYSRSEAQEAVRHLPDGDLSLEEKITEALRYFAQ